MTGMYQLQDNSELHNASDIKGDVAVETVEGALHKLSLDTNQSPSTGNKRPPDSDIAPTETQRTGQLATNDASSTIQAPVRAQLPQGSTEPSSSPAAPKVERNGGLDVAPPSAVTPNEEQLSPKDLALKNLGLKATHRPGFYLYEDNPQRMRIQTSTHAFDLDRRCPHAKADMLKWGVLRQNNTLVCGVHYWRFNLEDKGNCIAHPEESLNACPVERCIDW